MGADGAHNTWDLSVDFASIAITGMMPMRPGKTLSGAQFALKIRLIFA
jgi:hypothetical protein